MALPSWVRKGSILFLNPKTCGIYKNGGPRYKVDTTGQRTDEVDNQLLENVNELLEGKLPEGAVRILDSECKKTGILVPTYYDPRWDKEFDDFLQSEQLDEITLGELEEQGIITIFGGHGSPGNDQRVGIVPYIKVSDIRNLRININPTNMVPLPLAEKLWGDANSGLESWDLITPNRASSNIGEFAILLPGEEDIVLTKEVFIIRIKRGFELGWSPFYLMWAFCLTSVRKQWKRIALMQTNREDVSSRYKEIRLPFPKSQAYADEVSQGFRDYFKSIAESKQQFITLLENSKFSYIPNIMRVNSIAEDLDIDE